MQFLSISNLLFNRILIRSEFISFLSRRFIFIDKRQKKPRLGKFHGYSIKYQNAEHFKLSFKKGFTRALINEYGMETEINDTKLLVENRGQNVFRRLDNKKKKQLTTLYIEIITNILSLDETISKYKLIITKIELPNVLSEIFIYWKCYGDDRDKEVTQILKNSTPSILLRLRESFYMTTIPNLIFIADRSHLFDKEINELFALADYGIQYRALSHTGAILGSMKEDGQKPAYDKIEKIPNWLNKKKKI